MPCSVFPKYTRGERIADGALHVVGIVASVVAFVVLIRLGMNGETALMVAGFTIYGIALVATFCCSASYHFVTRPRAKEILRRFDHAAIFLMIAGTYTPFVLFQLNNAWGYSLLAVVWAIAIFGIAIKLIAPESLNRVSTALYLVQGWAVVLAWEPLRAASPASVLILLVVGGVLYTVGVVFHLWNRLPYQNAIWHAFVLVAAACHYAAVVDMVQLA